MKRYAKSQAELAAILNRSPVTLASWAALGAPCGGKDKRGGRYDAQAVKRWAAENGYGTGRNGATPGRKKAEDGPSKHVGALRKAQAEERGYKARIAQLNARRLEGELIAVIEVEAHDRKRHDYMISVLDNWARSLGPVLAGKTALEINRIMARKVREVMEEFSGR